MYVIARQKILLFSRVSMVKTHTYKKNSIKISFVETIERMDRDPLKDLKYYYLPLVDKKKPFNTSLQLIEKKTPHFLKKNSF